MNTKIVIGVIVAVVIIVGGGVAVFYSSSSNTTTVIDDPEWEKARKHGADRAMRNCMNISMEHEKVSEDEARKKCQWCLVDGINAPSEERERRCVIHKSWW